MSTDLDVLAARVAGVAASAESLANAAQRMAAYRDELIREARGAGLSAITLGRLAGVSRPRIYQILEAPRGEAAVDHYSDFAEHMDHLWEAALDRWDAHGGEGSVEDYFPLEEALR